MANGQMKYWVFHQEQLDKAIEEYIRARVSEGASAVETRLEAEAIQRFLDSPEGAPLQGGRAG